MKKRKETVFVVRYTSGSDLKVQITLDRSFKSEQAALDFIVKLRESDAEQGIERKIKYLGKESAP